MIARLFKDASLKNNYVDIHYKDITFEVLNITKASNLKAPLLLCRKDGKDYSVELVDIFYTETVDNQHFVYTKTDIFLSGISLQQVADFYMPFGFIRVSKSTVVSIHKVKCVEADKNMKYIITLLNEEKIILSRHYKNDFFEYLHIFINNK